MARFSDTQSKRSSRKLLFSLVPLVLMLVGVSVFLAYLQDKQVVDIQLKDDILFSPPEGFLQKVQTPEGQFYLLSHPETESPAIIETRFPVDKPKNTYRIVTVGASFAMGDPYVDPTGPAPGYGGIPSWLEVELANRYPSLKIEMINATLGGTNSFGVKKVFKKMVEVDPDLILVMTGNNEGFIPKTPFNTALQDWILYRALKKVILPDREPGERPLFPLQDPDNRRIESEFQKNIGEMIALAKEKKVTLCLATMPINVKFNGAIPAAEELAVPAPKGDSELKKGLEEMSAGQWEMAIETLSKSRNQTWAAFYIAQCLESLERYQQALSFYYIWVQRNPLGRTRPTLNEYIRKIGREQNVPFADLASAVEKSSPNGIADPELFVDNCHLTWQGYYKMTLEVLSVLIEKKMIPRQEGKPAEVLTAEQIIKKEGWEKLYSFKPPVWAPPESNQ